MKRWLMIRNLKKERNMKKIYLALLLIIILVQANSQKIINEETGMSFILDQPLENSQSYEYTASEYIKMIADEENGFQYSPLPGKYFHAKIDPFMVLPPDSNIYGGPVYGDDGVVGSLEGNLSVDQGGAAVYSIPINIPEGMNNMTPKLGVVYNSSGGTSVLGPKWNLSGFSSINRTMPTIYYNNEIDDLDFEDDQMILDGMMLIKIFENTDSIIYRTEIDQISQIIYYTNNSQTLDFDYYRVRTKSGLEKEYGNSLDSRQIYNPSKSNSEETPLIWHLSKVKDKKGNYISYEYIRDVETGELHPDAIRYTGFESNGSIEQQPYYKITFEYDTLPERLRRMHFFSKDANVYINRNTSLLKDIKVFYNETSEIKKFGFEYDELMSATKETFLSQITEYVMQEDNQYKHFNPTQIHWDYFSPEYTNDDISTNSKLHEDYLNHPMITADINGDCKDEIITVIADLYVSGKAYINVYTDKNPLKLTFYNYLSYCFSDFNNDGAGELAVAVEDSIFIYDILYNPSTEWYWASKVKTLLTTEVQVPIISNTSISAIDFNGDKAFDLAVNHNDSIVSFLKGEHGTFNFTHQTNFNMPTDHELQTYADFSGNGKTDIFTWKDEITTDRECYVYSYNGDGFVQTAHFTDFDYEGYYTYGDFNADGKTDIFSLIAGGVIKEVFFSYGNGFYESDTIICDGGLTFDNKILTCDLNNDHRADLVDIDKWGPNSIRIKGFFTQPDGKHYQSQVMENALIGYDFDAVNFAIGDFNGDNLYDVAVEIIEENPNSNLWNTSIKKFYYVPNEGFVMDLVGGISNGMGETSIINYQPFSNSLPENKQYTFPMSKTVKNSFLVESTWIEGGFSGQYEYYHNEYRFYQPISHLEGKGFLGFEEVIKKDCHNGVETISSYDIYTTNNRYYFPFEDTVRKYSLNLACERQKKIKHTINSFVHKETVSNIPLIFQPLKSSSFIKSWDDDNEHSFIRTSKIIIDISSVDIYGNIGKAIRLDDTDELSINDPASAYDYKVENEQQYYPANENDWLIGIRQNEKITKSFSEDEQDDIKLTEFTYFTNGELGYPSLKTEIKTPNNSSQHRLETWFTYDKYGHVLTETLKVPNAIPSINDQTITYEYSTENDYKERFLTRMIRTADGIEYVENMNYDILFGRLINSTDITGLTTNFKYDAMGKLYKTVFPGQTQSVEVLRWSENHDDSPNGSLFYIWKKSSGTAEELFFYNKHGHVLRHVNIGLNENKRIYTDYSYNSRGFNYKVTDPFFSDELEQGAHYISRDNRGRIERIVTPDKTIKYTFTGNQVTTLNIQSGKSVSETVNAINLVDNVIDETGSISYNYNSAGNVIEIALPDSEIHYSYDDAGFIESMVDPNFGPLSYIHNPLGQLIEQTDNKGNNSQFNYDDLGRMETVQILNTGEISTCLYYNTEGENGFGQLKSISGTNGVEYSYQYDELNRLNSYQEQIDGNFYTYHHTYDIFGRQKQLTYPSGFAIENKYNKNGFLIKIKDYETSAILWEALSDNARGQLESYSLGNGLTTTLQYDEYGFPWKIQTGSIQDLEFNFCPHTGNLNWRKDNKHSLVENFTYDTDKLSNRLTGWHVQGQTAYSLSLHDNGNIISKSDITQAGGTYNYNTGNKPHAVTAISQPTDEYMSAASPETIEYTAFNKISYLKQEYEAKEDLDVNELFFYYGPLYQRKKTEEYLNNALQKKKYFISNNYEIETDGQGNERKLHYLYAGDGLFAIYEIYNNQKEMYYIHKDYLGSYQSVTDEEGNLVEELSFDPWGRRRNPSDWSYNNVPENNLFDRGYTGHEHLNRFGLINMNGRMYDPYLARFLSPDPIIQNPKYSQNLNRYSYVLNNPLKYVDPSGYDWVLLSGSTQSTYYYITSVHDQESLDQFIKNNPQFSGATYLFPEGVVSCGYGNIWLKSDGTYEVILNEFEITSSGEYYINETIDETYLRYLMESFQNSNNSVVDDWMYGPQSGQGQTGGGDMTNNQFSGSEKAALGLAATSGSINLTTGLIDKLSGTVKNADVVNFGKSVTKKFGLVGVGMTTYNSFSDGTFTVGDGARILMSGVTFIPYAGWIYGAIDMGVLLTTGTSATDRIGNYVDVHWGPGPIRP